MTGSISIYMFIYSDSRKALVLVVLSMPSVESASLVRRMTKIFDESGFECAFCGSSAYDLFDAKYTVSRLHKSPKARVAKGFGGHDTLAQGSGSGCDARGLCQNVAIFVDEKGLSDLDVSRICCNESVKIT